MLRENPYIKKYKAKVILFLCITIILLVVIAVKQHQLRTIKENKQRIISANEIDNNFPKNLLIAHFAGITDLEYDPKLSNYKINQTVVLPSMDKKTIYPEQLIQVKEYVYLRCGNRLYKLKKTNIQNYTWKEFAVSKNDIEKLYSDNQKHLLNLAAIATNGQQIFVAAESALITLSTTFKEESRIKLTTNIPGKNAHDIIVYKDHAFLLDNITEPLLLFRVDLVNSKITNKIEMKDKNAHLDEQWIYPKQNQWGFTLTSNSHSDGHSGKFVYLYSMDNPEHANFIYRTAGYYLNTEDTILNILGVTQKPPIWSVLIETDKNYYLKKIVLKNNQINFENSIKLENMSIHMPSLSCIEARDVRIKHKNQYLFIAPGSQRKVEHWNINGSNKRLRLADENNLIIVDENTQKVIYNSSLKKFGIDGITDILPY